MGLKQEKRKWLYKRVHFVSKVVILFIILIIILSFVNISMYGLEGVLLEVSKETRGDKGKSTDRYKGGVLKGGAIKDFGDKRGLLGIGGIELGITLLKFDRFLHKMRGRGLSKEEKSKYYYKRNAGKFLINGFEDKNLLIKGRIITYKRHLAIKLLGNKAKKRRGGEGVFLPLSRLDKALKGVALKFYDDKLYEVEFEYIEDLTGLNVLIEEYHNLLGAGSEYTEVTSTYSWFLESGGNEYMITLNFLGEGFPRRVLIRYRHLREEEKASQYFHESKLQIDKIMKR